jgi:hypothetical protein
MLKTVIRVRSDVWSDVRMVLRQIVTFVMLTSVVLIPICFAHAEQEQCPPEQITYYYDPHIRRNVIDCHPDPDVLERLIYLGNLDYCLTEDPQWIELDGQTDFCSRVQMYKPASLGGE